MNQGHIGVGVVISVVKVVGQERAGNGKFVRLVMTDKVTDDAFARARARKDNLYFLMEVPIGIVSHLSHGPDADRLVFAVLFEPLIKWQHDKPPFFSQDALFSRVHNEKNNIASIC